MRFVVGRERCNMKIMRTLVFSAALLFVLAGCSSAGDVTTGSDGSASAGTPTATASVSPSPESTPSAHPTDLPSDVRTSDDGENITYTFASGDLTLSLPNTWTDIADSSQAFPIAVENPTGTQRIVVAEIGPSRLTPDVEPYRELLVEQLDVDDDQISYIGGRYAGDGTYPAFEVGTDDYAAWIFLVTADERLFELTVMGGTFDDGVAALDQITTLTNDS